MNKKTRALCMTMFKDYPDVLDIEQVSHILNISTKTTYKIIKSGALSCLRVGRQIRVPKYFLMRYLNIVEKETR